MNSYKQCEIEALLDTEDLDGLKIPHSFDKVKFKELNKQIEKRKEEF